MELREAEMAKISGGDLDPSRTFQRKKKKTTKDQTVAVRTDMMREGHFERSWASGGESRDSLAGLEPSTSARWIAQPAPVHGQIVEERVLVAEVQGRRLTSLVSACSGKSALPPPR